VGKGVFDQAFETQVRGMRKAYDSRVLPRCACPRLPEDELDALVAEIARPPSKARARQGGVLAHEGA
jgi:hypothetical protein